MKKLYVLDKGIYIFKDNTISLLDVYKNYVDKQDAYTCFKEKLKTMKKLVNKKNPKLLDIGCGPGYFVCEAEKYGFIAEGVDISRSAIKFAEKELKIKVYNEDILKMNFKDKKYDIIHMKTFLEHVSNPIKYIEKAYELLNKNGILYIEGPNDFSFIQRLSAKLFNLNKWWINYPHHLSYITKKAMKNVLIKKGFSICLEEMTFPVEIFIFLGFNYIKYPEKGKYVGKFLNFLTDIRNKYLFIRKLSSRSRKLISYIDLGRRYVFYARKEFL